VANPLLDKFKENDVVVTPSGRRAAVIAYEGDGAYLVRYMDLPFTDEASLATINQRLLAKWQPGRAEPLPVRVIA
jgi:hypothetical protein